MPYVEKHYRVIADRAHRAIAGLSMGGSQTLNVAMPRLDKFAYVGVYSSGILGGGRGAAPAPGTTAPPFGAAWEQQNLAALDNASTKKGLKMLWFATGVDDGLIGTTRSTVELFKRHGFAPTMKETPGGHTWLNWRAYLIEFVPQLFLIRGASPLGLPDTLSRAPLRRRAPFAWLTRCARSLTPPRAICERGAVSRIAVACVGLSVLARATQDTIQLSIEPVEAVAFISVELREPNFDCALSTKVSCA